MSYSDQRNQVMQALGQFYHGKLDGAFGTKAQEAFDALKAARDQEDHAPPVTQPSTPATLQRLMVNGAYTGIIDLSHGNGLNLPRLKEAGFAAIIHKASEGLSFKDPLYLARRKVAKAAGFLWGAYHFASGDEGKAQAKNFLDAIGNFEDDGSTLFVLDFEPSSHGPNMTISQGRDWINAVHDATGRWPMVYGGGGLLRDLLEGRKDDTFARCPLWLCDIREKPRIILPNWPAWTLLQYCGDGQGQQPMDVPGSDGADRNSFPGTEIELRSIWPFSKT